jgi:hypothetical protein
MSLLAVKGGIGDFLQYLPFMLAHPEHRYLVASHYNRVQEFFEPLGVKVEELSLGRLAGIDNCPRSLFLKGNPFKPQAPVFTDRGPIGVHLGGSAYSLSVEKRFGLPSKALPLTVLEMLVWASNHNFLLFGSPEELAELGVKESHRVRFINSEDVTVSLSHVAECSALIGSDSAFKTMSAMLGIPTVVWVGDYTDTFRDANFIHPYVRAGVMSVFRYNDLSSNDEVSSGVNFSLGHLRLANA